MLHPVQSMTLARSASHEIADLISVAIAHYACSPDQMGEALSDARREYQRLGDLLELLEAKRPALQAAG